MSDTKRDLEDIAPVNPQSYKKITLKQFGKWDLENVPYQEHHRTKTYPDQ